MITTVLNLFPNNMKLFVYESDDREKAAEHQVLAKQRGSITRIRYLFLRSSTAANFQPRPPAATIDRVTNPAPLQRPPTVDDDVFTAPKQQTASGTSDDVVIVAFEEEV